MNEVVFLTEAEAEAQQALDLQDHLATHSDEPYVSQTTRWATPSQRLDGKWAYPCCAHTDYSGLTVEAYDPANYPAPPIEE
jgi:hypothetical protein